MRSDDVMGKGVTGVDLTGLIVFECESIDPKIDRALFSLGSCGELVLCPADNVTEEINATSPL